MCGFVGFMLGFNKSRVDCIDQAKSMLDCIKHRGPDDSGIAVFEEDFLTIGHRRLSVIDLTSSGHQPMVSHTGRYVISFNGEIYNHMDIRQELSKEFNNILWRGSSDTETLITAIERYGFTKAVNKFVGMFAFALWDKHNKELYLSRDRLGEKPLYYGWSKGSFIFSSELKALKNFHGFCPSINRDALDQYLRLMYVPSPLSIYEDIYKLEAGCVMRIKKGVPDKLSHYPVNLPFVSKNTRIERWWSLENVARSGANNQILDDSSAIRQLDNSLCKSVDLQMLSDVPIGAFLSGGIDSSLIVSLMQERSTNPINTYTIGFEKRKYDESKHALEVAKYLGTNHTEIIVTSSKARDVIPLLPYIYDEPFADSSQIPTYLVSKLARKDVTVALSGDGADELFGGYNRYTQGPEIWSKALKTPYLVRRFLASSLTSIPISTWDNIGNSLYFSKISGRKFAQLGDKVYKVSEKLKNIKNIDDMYLNPITEWSDNDSLVKNMSKSNIHYSDQYKDFLLTLDDEYKMMYLDSQTYLPDDILCKVDRASMSCSLETRSPFLDHRVVELSWRLQKHMKINNNIGKCVLRELLYKRLPKKIIDRPKIGFGIPIGQWLRGPLRDWAEELISVDRLEKDGYLYPGPIRKIWNLHLSGKYDYSSRLWAVLMFQSWIDRTK